MQSHGPSTLPDPSKGNHSLNTHAELLETRQHNATAANTVLAANKASHRAQVQKLTSHQAWRGTSARSQTLTAATRAAQHPEVTLPHELLHSGAQSCLTRMPAFFTAKGRPSSPVPTFPFNRWIRVWYHLRERRYRDDCRQIPAPRPCTVSALGSSCSGSSSSELLWETHTEI